MKKINIQISWEGSDFLSEDSMGDFVDSLVSELEIGANIKNGEICGEIVSTNLNNCSDALVVTATWVLE